LPARRVIAVLSPLPRGNDNRERSFLLHPKRQFPASRERADFRLDARRAARVPPALPEVKIAEAEAKNG